MRDAEHIASSEYPDRGDAEHEGASLNQSAQRETSADNDRCVLQSWHEWEVVQGERRIILYVETGLELRPGYPGFDLAQLEALIANATEMMRTSASPVDSLRIVPARSML